MVKEISYKTIFIFLILVLILGIGSDYFLNYLIDNCRTKTHDFYKCTEKYNSRVFGFMFYPLWFITLFIIQIKSIIYRHKRRVVNEQIATTPKLSQNLSLYFIVGLSISASILTLVAWDYLLSFLSQIGILKDNQIGFGGIAVGMMILFISVFLVVPAYLFSFKRNIIWQKKLFFSFLIFLVSGLQFYPVYSLRSFEPHPIKYWFNDPTNFYECIDAGSITEVDINGNYCQFNRRGWSEDYLYDKEDVARRKAEKPYFILDLTRVNMKVGETKDLNIQGVNPLGRPIQLVMGRIYSSRPNPGEFGKEYYFGKVINQGGGKGVLQLNPGQSDIGNFEVYIHIANLDGSIIDGQQIFVNITE